MGAQKRFICLLVDNFFGHLIAYTPCHIQLEFFAPNLTSFIQPLDAGIIWCFKALYHKAFCKHAIDLDEASEHNIFKIDLHEAMLMAKEAWAQVTPETIKHSWDHTGIQADSCNPSQAQTSHPTHADPHTWSILWDFATNDSMTLPMAENQLQQLLSDSYVDKHWWAALMAVMNAEGDTKEASVAVEKLTAAATHHTGLVIKIPALRARPLQLAGAKEEILKSVKNLKDHNHIFSTPITLDKLLAPREETEIGEERYQFEDDEVAIVMEVKHQMAVEQGEIMEIKSDDEDTQPYVAPLPHSKILEMCKKLEMICMSESDTNTSLELPQLLHKFHGELHWQE